MRLPRICLCVVALWFGGLVETVAADSPQPIKVVIVGMLHGHVNGWLRADRQAALELVGVFEPDQAVTRKYQDRYQMDGVPFYTDLDRLLEEQKPEAAWVFTTTFDHEKVVEACARRGIHVIVEKPLAVDLASAKRMAKLARAHGIHLLTNLETTWYASLGAAYRLAVEEDRLGALTKIVSHFGHQGPVGINSPAEFLAWLTDPKLNGGGASADFACYGANITTWLMRNERPSAVTAVFQTNDPETYPKVDDAATLVLEYPHTQAIIQAGWNWTFPRKDVHIYGRSGQLRTIDANRFDLRMDRRKDPEVLQAEPLPATRGDAVTYFTAVIRGELDPRGSLSSLENNLIAVEIVEAAKRSARTGQRVVLPLAN